MSKREGYRIYLQKQTEVIGNGLVPRPRENGTLVTAGNQCYLMGGMNSEPVTEVMRAELTKHGNI